MNHAWLQLRPVLARCRGTTGDVGSGAACVPMRLERRSTGLPLVVVDDRACRRRRAAGCADQRRLRRAGLAGDRACPSRLRRLAGAGRRVDRRRSSLFAAASAALRELQVDAVGDDRPRRRRESSSAAARRRSVPAAPAAAASTPRRARSSPRRWPSGSAWPAPGPARCPRPRHRAGESRSGDVGSGSVPARFGDADARLAARGRSGRTSSSARRPSARRRASRSRRCSSAPARRRSVR